MITINNIIRFIYYYAIINSDILIKELEKSEREKWERGISWDTCVRDAAIHGCLGRTLMKSQRFALHAILPTGTGQGKIIKRGTRELKKNESSALFCQIYS